MTKKERLRLILTLIEENEIDNQKELTDALLSAGCDVSQATVSRDINELNLIKVAGAKRKTRYAQGSNGDEKFTGKFAELFKQVSVSIASANNLIVIKTLSGNAGAAGMAIDAMQAPEILGTVAGDDTLLIITKSNKDAELLLKRLRNI